MTVEPLIRVVAAVVDRGFSNPRLFGFDIGVQLRVVVSILVSVFVNIRLE